MKALSVSHLTKVFKTGLRRQSLTALDDVTFDLDEGRVLGIIGPNGSGKSTLFKCILQFIKINGGDIKLFEGQFRGNVLSRKIGYLHEKINFYPELTPEEHLWFFGKLYHIPKSVLRSRIPELLELVNLTPFADARVNTFSKGMVQRVGIAASLIHDSEFLIFDEPSSGLDLFGMKDIQSIMRKLVDKGKTLLVSSHDFSQIQGICNEVLILYKGRLLKKGSVEELLLDRNEFNIAIDTQNSNHEEAVRLLEQAGFQIHQAGFSQKELSELFTSVIGQEK